MPIWMRTNKTILPIGLLALVLWLQCDRIEAADHSIATITTISGSVSVQRPLGKTSTSIGDRLVLGDVIETGPDGAVGMLFNDDTTISLGPDSKLEIQDFIFQPEASSFSFAVKLFRGTAVYISGLIAKISSKATRFITPSTSIGIRGTMLAIEVEEI